MKIKEFLTESPTDIVARFYLEAFPDFVSSLTIRVENFRDDPPTLSSRFRRRTKSVGVEITDPSK